MSKPKKIEPNHILWLVLLLAAGSLPLFASLGRGRSTPEGIEKAGPEAPAAAKPSVSAPASASVSAPASAPASGSASGS